MSTPNFQSSLPANVLRALNAGLAYTKVKSPDDAVATTAQVEAPQVTPTGSDLGGQVAVTSGAPVENFITLIVDTSAFDEDEEVVAYLGDASQVHELSCTSCSTTENKATVYIGSSACDKYPVFLSRLCSTPYTFGAINIRATKTAGASSGSTVELTEMIGYSRKNINGEGSFGNIYVNQFENLEAYPRNDLKYADIALTDESNRFDRDTQWRIPGLVGKRKYEIRLYTAFRKSN